MNDREQWVKHFYDLVLIYAPHTGSIYGDFLKNEIEFTEIEKHKYTEYAWESYNALRSDGLIIKENLTHDRLTPKGIQESINLRNAINPKTKNIKEKIMTSWLFQHKSEIGITLISGVIVAWVCKMLGII